MLTCRYWVKRSVIFRTGPFSRCPIVLFTNRVSGRLLCDVTRPSRRDHRSTQTTTPEHVIPLHLWDTTYRHAILYHLSRFDDVLDVDKLKWSLVKLLNHDGWKKLGARMQKNRRGGLEYIIPYNFSDSRSSFTFHHVHHETSIAAHPLASKISRASDRVKIVAKCDEFLPLMRQADDPAKLSDYLKGDRPILGLHVVSFTDSTLVTLSCSHAVLDGGGRKALLEAWSLVLQDRDSEVQPLHGFDSDPLAKLGTCETEPYKSRDRLMRPWQMAKFALRVLFDGVNGSGRAEGRMICIPSAAAQRLRQAAMSQLEKKDQAIDQTSGTWLSYGDVLCAWWSRIIVDAAPKHSQQEIVINNVLGLRKFKDILPGDEAYISNAITMMPTFFKTEHLLSQSLGHTAAALRSTVKRLGTRAQVEARFALDRVPQQKRGVPGLYGDPNMRMIICTNWTKSGIYDLDFSPAVVKKKPGQVPSRVGRPSYTQMYAYASAPSFMNSFSLNQDANGNFWIYSLLPIAGGYWENVERHLEDVTF